MPKEEEAKTKNDVKSESEAQKPDDGDEKAKTDDYAELKERMLRLAAEFDNYKKRVKKDIDSAQNMGKASLIKDLLPVIDEFDIALLAMNGSNDKLSKGIEMLYSNLMDTLEKEGLSIIDCKGVFDPYRHEIMMMRESDKKEGTIIEVVKKGYMFGDMMLRPASVIVARGKENDEEKENEE